MWRGGLFNGDRHDKRNFLLEPFCAIGHQGYLPQLHHDALPLSPPVLQNADVLTLKSITALRGPTISRCLRHVPRGAMRGRPVACPSAA